jgi:hypothetical protein
MSTCNWWDLQTLESQPIMLKISSIIVYGYFIPTRSHHMNSRRLMQVQELKEEVISLL